MKIVSISPNGTWNSNDGNTFYKFQIQLDLDGATLIDGAVDVLAYLMRGILAFGEQGSALSVVELNLEFVERVSVV